MNILVVDDESLARERLLRLVGKLRPGARCWQAASGQQALELVQAHDPDLILLDIRMPGMDGIELAAHLDKLEQPPAIIFCTTSVWRMLPATSSFPVNLPGSRLSLT